MNKFKQKLMKLKIMEPLVLYRMYQKDKDFNRLVNSFKDNKLIIYEEKNENPHIPNNIYHIKIDDPKWGFFACWWWTLNELYYSDLFNLIPVVDWTSGNAYYEEHGVDGSKNPFEYYFQQITEYGLDDLKEYDSYFNIINLRTKKRNTYLYGKDYSKLAEINKKYMKLKPNVENQIKKDINNLIGNKKTLAVHIRGVEWGNVNGHPIPLNIDKYIEKIDDALSQCNFEQIFLATDSDDNIEYLKDRYGDKVVFYNDVARAKKGSKTLVLFDNSIQRDNNHYLMGLEVLRDMLTLASCDGFIAGLSNISCAVQITKLSNDEEFLYLHIFEQKIQTNGISSEQAVRGMKKGKFKG